MKRFNMNSDGMPEGRGEQQVREMDWAFPQIDEKISTS